MKDPLEGTGSDRELFEKVGRLVFDKPLSVVWNVAANLLVNAIRQRFARRDAAEAAINEVFNRAKTVLLDVHYDSVTGRRRGLVPHTQVIEMPFHDEGNVIFPIGK